VTGGDEGPGFGNGPPQPMEGGGAPTGGMKQEYGRPTSLPGGLVPPHMQREREG